MMWLIRPLYFRKIIHSWKLRLLIPKVICLKICHTMQTVKKKKLLHFMVENAENKQKWLFHYVYVEIRLMLSQRHSIYKHCTPKGMCKDRRASITSYFLFCFLQAVFLYWLTLNWQRSTCLLLLCVVIKGMCYYCQANIIFTIVIYPVSSSWPSSSIVHGLLLMYNEYTYILVQLGNV